MTPLLPTLIPVPVMVTVSPPAVFRPLLGSTFVTVGGAVYVIQLVQVPLWESGLVTTTLYEPAALAGAVAVN